MAKLKFNSITLGESKQSFHGPENFHRSKL